MFARSVQVSASASPLISSSNDMCVQMLSQLGLGFVVNAEGISLAQRTLADIGEAGRHGVGQRWHGYGAPSGRNPNRPG